MLRFLLAFKAKPKYLTTLTSFFGFVAIATFIGLLLTSGTNRPDIWDNYWICAENVVPLLPKTIILRYASKHLATCGISKQYATKIQSILHRKIEAKTTKLQNYT